MLRNYKRRAVILLLVILLGAGGFIAAKYPSNAKSLSAGDWNSGRIIDDAIFFNANTMNPGDIQNFLNAKVPVCDTNGTQSSGRAGYPTRASWGAANGASAPYVCLKNFTQSIGTIAADAYCNGIGGSTKSAADIIFNVAQACGINPQVLLVLLQKEQSLITDDWPWPIQYRSATGYGCPDTAPCDAEYYGFFNQTYNAARQFKRYIQSPGSFNYAVGRTSFVAYNPNAACGGSNVTIATQATAALYNYTPYQPNASALNNLYGAGDSCGAYGNRNFWRTFTDWFGSTRSDSFTLAIGDNGSPAQYLLFGGIKQAIPDPETKIAWGIENYPVVTMSSSYLASIPSGPQLDRLTRLNTSDNTVFFMDGGKRYRVMSQAMFDAWNFGGRPITNVPPGLFYVPTDGGQLTYSVKNPSNSTTYMLDGSAGGLTVIRPHANEYIRKAWEGDGSTVIPISSSFFNQIDNAIGTTITSTKFAFRSNEYQVMSGYKMPQPGHIAPLYPGSAQTYSDTTFWRLFPGPTLTYLIRPINGAEVYLVDGGTKHHILSPDVLNAWSVSGNPIIGVNSGFLDSIPNGGALSAYFADTAGQLYIIDKAKMPIPSSLDTAYRNSSSVYSASSSLLSIFQTTPNQATGFVKGTNSPAAFVIDNSGKKRHMEWTDKVVAWAGTDSTVMKLSDYIVNSIASSASPSMYVTDGTVNYVMDGGRRWTVSASIANDWGLASPQLYSDGTLGRFPIAGPLDNEIRDNMGGYFLVRGGNAYGTADQNVADVWTLKDGQVHNTGIITGILRVFMLTRIVQSNAPGDDRFFVVNNGQWFNISAQQRANIVGSNNESIMRLNPSLAPNIISDWTSLVVKSSSGNPYVIDGGGKRYFIHQMVYDQWTNYGILVMPTVSDGFLNLLPTRGYIERAVKGSAPMVYSAEAGVKRHIQYPNTYNLYYAPYIGVSDQLINAMPTGVPI